MILPRVWEWNSQITISGRVKGRPAIEQDGRVRRRAQAGQHNKADSEPRTSWRAGEGADRRQWRMQGSGRRENNEQTRGYLYRRSMR